MCLKKSSYYFITPYLLPLTVALETIIFLSSLISTQRKISKQAYRRKQHCFQIILYPQTLHLTRNSWVLKQSSVYFGNLSYLERAKVSWKGFKKLRMLVEFLLNNSYPHPLFSIKDWEVYRQRKVKCTEYILSPKYIICINTFNAHNCLIE